MKKVPIRKCMGCNAQKEKNDLVRIVHSPDGEISVDFTGKKNGRGGYICKDPKCLAMIIKSRRLEKIFDKKIPESVYEALAKEFEKVE